jgi:hypothetical protein
MKLGDKFVLLSKDNWDKSAMEDGTDAIEMMIVYAVSDDDDADVTSMMSVYDDDAL